MNKTDTLFRAIKELKKQTEQSRECNQELNAVIRANSDTDAIDFESATCIIEEDWIVVIEEGLEFIKKSIDEARQFIRSTGETVPIEKVKSVSRDSVEHLAKHSDYISRMPKGKDKDIVPDKLFVVERLNDFTVYENKFICFLLVYLKNFCSYRYNKIMEVLDTYRCGLSINKTVITSKRKLRLKMEFFDEARGDEFLKKDNEALSLLRRIENILKTIEYFLAIDLMSEVSKVPMLKPPIIKNNVLKMNRNFKEAVKVYDFVRAYDKPGYAVKIQKRNISPFPEDTANEFAHTIMLTAFLLYKNGLGLENTLEELYLKEEERRKEEREKETKNRLAQLKSRVKESGGDPFEYMLLLESHNDSLEGELVRLMYTKQELGVLSDKICALEKSIVLLDQEIEDKKIEIISINKAHAEKIAAQKKAFDEEIQKLKEKHSQEKTEINQRHTNLVETLNAAHKEAKTELENTINSQQEEFRKSLSEARSEFEQRKEEFDKESKEINHRLSERETEFETLKNEKRLNDAQLLALRKKNNLIREDEDFSSKASFDELEEQFILFKRFMKEEWAKTKKRIRKEVFKGSKKEDEKEDAAEKNSEESAE